MIRHMRHGSPPRLMALQSILSPNRRESLPTPSAGVRITAVDLESTGPSSCSKQTTIGSERLPSWTAATERHGPTLKYDQARGCCPGATPTDFYRARLVRALRNAGDLESAASQIETLHTVAPLPTPLSQRCDRQLDLRCRIAWA